MKVMISQPMKGKSDSEILLERSLILTELSKHNELNLLDTFVYEIETNPI